MQSGEKTILWVRLMNWECADDCFHNFDFFPTGAVEIRPLICLTFQRPVFTTRFMPGAVVFRYRERFDLLASRVPICCSVTEAESTAKPGQKILRKISAA